MEPDDEFWILVAWVSVMCAIFFGFYFFHIYIYIAMNMMYIAVAIVIIVVLLLGYLHMAPSPDSSASSASSSSPSTRALPPPPYIGTWAPTGEIQVSGYPGTYENVLNSNITLNFVDGKVIFAEAPEMNMTHVYHRSQASYVIADTEKQENKVSNYSLSYEKLSDGLVVSVLNDAQNIVAIRRYARA